jgi:peptidoglycan/xylan/chitin deacetylase (PgdA/CDA1 family)
VAVGVALTLSACTSGSTRFHAVRHIRFATNHKVPAPSTSSSSPPPTAPPTTTVPRSTTTTIPAGPLAPVVFRVHTRARVVFVTIDDGTVRDPRVLLLEERMHLPLSLFIVAGPATVGRAYWQQMHAAGATIEEHTLTHPFLTRLPFANQQHEICGDLDQYALWFGARPVLFRPPYGDYDAASRRAANSCGLRAVMLWTATMQAGRFDVVGHRLEPGDIILLHFTHTLYSDLLIVLARIHAAGFQVGRLETSLTAADLVTAPAQPQAHGQGD